MLRKEITYTDYDNNQRTEAFYFNLSKAEIIEMQVSVDGGLAKMLQKIIDANDGKRIVGTLKDIILKSYGEKSPDGRRFIKSQELRDSFEQTEAFSELFIELSTNDKAAAEFVNGIMPAEAMSGNASGDALKNGNVTLLSPAT